MTDTQDRDSPRDDGPFEQGYAAWSKGVPFRCNPFCDDNDWSDWNEGWRSARDEGRERSVKLTYRAGKHFEPLRTDGDRCQHCNRTLVDHNNGHCP